MNLHRLAAHQADADQVGEVFYLIDANFRTQAQGWTRADRTGPLDLYLERNGGYVFGSGGPAGSGILDYSTDAAAAQAALDAMIDYRNDLLYVTPGSYSIATALAVNVESARIRGPKRGNPRSNLVTVTDAVGNAFTITTSNVELGHFTVIPKTAKILNNIGNGANFGHMHHIFYNAEGVSTSTSTEFINAAATTTDWLIEDSLFEVDVAQGDAFTLAGAKRWVISRNKFNVKGDGKSWASVATLDANCLGNLVEYCSFTQQGSGNTCKYTNIFTGAAGIGLLQVQYCTVNGTAMATAGDIETGFDATLGIELAENYLTGDATTEGGTLIKLT